MSGVLYLVPTPTSSCDKILRDFSLHPRDQIGDDKETESFSFQFHANEEANGRVWGKLNHTDCGGQCNKPWEHMGVLCLSILVKTTDPFGLSPYTLCSSIFRPLQATYKKDLIWP